MQIVFSTLIFNYSEDNISNFHCRLKENEFDMLYIVYVIHSVHILLYFKKAFRQNCLYRLRSSLKSLCQTFNAQTMKTDPLRAVSILIGHTADSATQASSVTLKIWQHEARENYSNI